MLIPGDNDLQRQPRSPYWYYVRDVPKGLRVRVIASSSKISLVDPTTAALVGY